MKTKIHRYEGGLLTVTWDKERCIHAAECVKELPQVFDPRGRPWVTPDEAPLDEVEMAVMGCPTGALQFEGKSGLAGGETSPEPAHVLVSPDGPLYIKGDVVVKNAQGEILLEDTRLALCRCGASKNKPLCDGHHTKMSFSDAGELKNASLKGEADAEGRLEVTVAADGPLILSGPMMVFGAHRAYDEGSGGALCRCGASDNKPFCDGSHKGAGFSDP